MEIDEEGTHGRVKRIERDLIEPSIAGHHGKLVKTTGDGFIAIFDSPVEAVRCGIVIQQNMIGRNASLPKHHWIEYRIGVNLGDVIIEADDVYGDGVNVASRLEGIAEPGEVYISGGIYEQIKHKLVCGYESLGDRKVKNITDPVRVFACFRIRPLSTDPKAAREHSDFLVKPHLAGHRRRRPLVLFLQPHGKERTSVSPGFPGDAEGLSAPPPSAKQAAPRPQPASGIAYRPASITANPPAPSVAPAAKQAASQPQPRLQHRRPLPSGNRR